MSDNPRETYNQAMRDYLRCPTGHNLKAAREAHRDLPRDAKRELPRRVGRTLRYVDGRKDL